LALALHFTWRAPYVFLAGLCVSIWSRPGLSSRRYARTLPWRERNALAQLRRVFGEPNHLRILRVSRRPLVFSGSWWFPFMALT